MGYSCSHSYQGMYPDNHFPVRISVGSVLCQCGRLVPGISTFGASIRIRRRYRDGAFLHLPVQLFQWFCRTAYMKWIRIRSNIWLAPDAAGFCLYVLCFEWLDIVVLLQAFVHLPSFSWREITPALNSVGRIFYCTGGVRLLPSPVNDPSCNVRLSAFRSGPINTYKTVILSRGRYNGENSLSSATLSP